MESHAASWPTGTRNAPPAFAQCGCPETAPAKVTTDGDRDQVTQYVYGVTPAAVSGSQVQSDLWTNDLLLKVIYLDELGSGAASEADRTVWYAYNRQGELASTEDQNDTLHAYTRDPAGRVTADTATLAGGSVIDATIRTIATGYDDAGRVASVASLDASSTPVTLNEVELEYTKLWQVEKVWQDDKAAVSSSGGAPTSDTRLVKYTYGTNAVNGSGSVTNFSRLTAMDYPRNLNTGTPVTASLSYGYGSGGGVSDAISRPVNLSLDGTSVVNYEHVGAGIVALVDYEQPDLQLDRTLSAEGKRRTVGYATQSAGTYPGLDRFGRVARQEWADGTLTQHGSLSTVPNIPPLVELGYTYDRSGSRTSNHDIRPGNQWRMSHDYGYDGLHRLTSATRGIHNGSSVTSAAGSQTWTLDLLGNWAEWKNDADYSGSYSSAETDTRRHSGVNELFERDWGSAGADETLTYDANGNLRTRVAGGVTTTYTHDAWNRLVKVVVGSSTMLEQQHNGLSWRTWKRADTNNDGILDEERTFAYSSGWQLLEERVDSNYVSSPGLDKRVQHVWGKRYIDDAVLQRCDRNNDGDYVDTNEFTWYHLTDAMFSTVAMSTRTGTIHERVTYDAYGTARHHWNGDVDADGDVDGTDRTTVNGLIGKSIGQTGYRSECDLDRDGTITTADRTIASSSKSALASGLMSDATASGPDNVIGWDGYVLNSETRLYTVRHRSYEPVLGRWLERDQLGFLQGPLLYQYSSSSPSDNLDPSGLSDLRLPGGGIRFDIQRDPPTPFTPRDRCMMECTKRAPRLPSGEMDPAYVARCNAACDACSGTAPTSDCAKGTVVFTNVKVQTKGDGGLYNDDGIAFQVELHNEDPDCCSEFALIQLVHAKLWGKAWNWEFDDGSIGSSDKSPASPYYYEPTPVRPTRIGPDVPDFTRTTQNGSINFTDNPSLYNYEFEILVICSKGKAAGHVYGRFAWSKNGNVVRQETPANPLPTVQTNPEWRKN